MGVEESLLLFLVPNEGNRVFKNRVGGKNNDKINKIKTKW